MLASAGMVVAILYFAQEVLIPVALAMLLSFLLAPLVRRLERLRIPRVPSVIVIVLSLFALIGLLGYVVGRQVVNLATNVDAYKENIIAKARRFQPAEGGLVTKVVNAAEDVSKKIEHPQTAPVTQPTDIVAQEIAQRTQTPQAKSRTELGQHPDVQPTTQATTSLGRALLEAVGLIGGPWTKENPFPTAVIQPRPSPLEQLWSYVSVILGPLGTAGIVLVFVIFMLLERENLRDRMIRLIGHGQLTVTTQALDDASTRISKYLTAQAIVNGTYGAAIAIGLWLIGLLLGKGTSFPNVILWGLLCGILRFIPYIGPWIGAAFPILISLAVYKGFGVFGATVGLFVVIELLSNNFMEPWLYGASTGMSTVAILVAAVFWTWLWGAIGLLLSTPLTVVLVVMGKYVPHMQFLDILLGDEPVLEPGARVYQRLLALDQEEAGELVREHLRKTSLEDLYDNVLIRTLSLAEQDRHRNALEERRLQFILRAIREMIEELDEEQRVLELKEAAAAVEQAAKGEKPLPENGNAANLLPPTVVPAPQEKLPAGCTINIVTLPSHDEADEIIGLMLTQLLNRRGYCGYTVSQTALAGEMMEELAQRTADIVVVSALPPASVSHSRYLCKRVRQKFEAVPMIVGLWTYSGNLDKARERLMCVASIQIATTLAEMLHLVHQTAAPLVSTRQGEASAAEASATEAPRTKSQISNKSEIQSTKQ
jgi:predicted PurR-regulated permease PerM